MSTSDDTLDRLFERYLLAAVDGDVAPDPADLCVERPDLLPELLRRIEILDDVGTFLSSPGTLLTGSRLDRYAIVAELGRGTMGRVYLGRDDGGREVAIKMFPPEYEEDHERRARFLREAEALRRLDHPGIVSFLDLLEVDERRFIVMERVRGRSLIEEIAEGPFPPKKVRRIARDLAEVLAAVHAEGIVHRDLKPSNVMLSDDGAVRVLDFGLAHLQGDTDAESLTLSGTLLGTVSYMAPEQLLEGTFSPRTDIFALGTILYELCRGEPPFDGPSLPAVISAILELDPEPLSELRPDLPADLVTTISRCLEKDPEKRPADAAEIARALAAPESP